MKTKKDTLTIQMASVIVTNEDNQVLFIETDKGDPGIVNITINNEEFWLYKGDVNLLINALRAFRNSENVDL